MGQFTGGVLQGWERQGERGIQEEIYILVVIISFVLCFSLGEDVIQFFLCGFFFCFRLDLFVWYFRWMVGGLCVLIIFLRVGLRLGGEKGLFQGFLVLEGFRGRASLGGDSGIASFYYCREMRLSVFFLCRYSVVDRGCFRLCLVDGEGQREFLQNNRLKVIML